MPETSHAKENDNIHRGQHQQETDYKRKPKTSQTDILLLQAEGSLNSDM